MQVLCIPCFYVVRAFAASCEIRTLSGRRPKRVQGELAQPYWTQEFINSFGKPPSRSFLWG